MAKFQVQSFKEKQTKNGKTYYLASGLLDGAPDVVSIWSLPEIGKEYEGTTKENDYGITFTPAGQGGGGRGNWNDNPERQASIIRQNSLQHATQVAVTLAQMEFATYDDKKAGYDSVKAMLTPNNIFKLADIFVAYSDGTLKSASRVAAEASAVGEHKADVPSPAAEAEHPTVTKSDNTPMNGDVHPDEIPF